MSDLDKKYLQGFTAIEILKNVYSNTLGKIVFDLQNQINGSQEWLDNPQVPGNKLSDSEVFNLIEEIKQKTNYVKSLLEFYADYNHPSKEIQDLCKYYGIKTFNDNLRIQENNLSS